jgi:hypothetical protein
MPMNFQALLKHCTFFELPLKFSGATCREFMASQISHIDMCGIDLFILCFKFQLLINIESKLVCYEQPIVPNNEYLFVFLNSQIRVPCALMYAVLVC